MIGWAQLRDAARPLPPAPNNASLAARLGGRRWKLGDVGRRVSWPAAADIAAALEEAKPRLCPHQLAQLADLMLEPQRAYVLRALEGEERYALVGSWAGPDLAFAEVLLRPGADDGQRLKLRLTGLPADAPGLADDLNAVYMEVDPRHRSRSDPSRRTLDQALWIGGSAGEARDEEWEHAVAALFASRGLDVDVFGRPGDATLDHSLRRVEGFRGVVTVVWGPRAGDGERRARLIAAAKGPPIVLGEPEFEVALTEAAVELDSRDQERAEEVAGIASPATPQQPLTGGPHYFKKTGSGGGGYGDRMELMPGPCIHNAFRRARRPDQAKRGIARVAKAPPLKLEHCGSCTRGGFWRAWF